MAKEIGYEVDVLRDLWGPGQWPLEIFVQPEDQKLVRENAPMIELMWNLIQVQLPEIVDADNSQSPMGGTGSSTPCLATSSWYAGAKRVIANCLTDRGTESTARKR